MFPLLMQVLTVNGSVPEGSNVAESVVSPTTGKYGGGAESLFAQLLALLSMPLVPVTNLPILPDSKVGEALISGEAMEGAAVSGEPIADPEINVSSSGDANLMMTPCGDSVPMLQPVSVVPTASDRRILPPPPENFSGQAETGAPVACWLGRDMECASDCGTINGLQPFSSPNTSGQPRVESADLVLNTATQKGKHRPEMSLETEELFHPVGDTKVKYSVRTEPPFSAPREICRSLPVVMPVAQRADGEIGEILSERVTPAISPKHPVGSLFRKTKEKADFPEVHSVQAVLNMGHISVSGSVMEKPVMSIRESTAISTWSEPVLVSELPKVLSALTIAAANTGENRALLRLHPEHLGEVRAEITLRDGGCHVRLLPTLPVAHEALSTQADTLRDALTRQGMCAVSVEVSREGMGGDWGTGGQRKEWEEATPLRPQQAGGIGSVRSGRGAAASTRFTARRGGLDVKV